MGGVRSVKACGDEFILSFPQGRGGRTDVNRCSRWVGVKEETFEGKSRHRERRQRGMEEE